MAIKKAFEGIVDILENNLDKKVKNVLPEITALCEAKKGGSGAAGTFLKNDGGTVVAILCYYYKRWMVVNEVEFGPKANSSTGYNSMCKEGVRHWTKQNNAAKKAAGDLLTQVKAGTLAVENIAAEEKTIAENRAKIEATDLGFETKEQVIAHLAESGITVSEVSQTNKVDDYGPTE